MQFIQRFLYNTDRQIFGILYINNIYYNNTLHTYVYLNSVQTFFSSVSHALHASGNSKALTPIGREISLEMSAVYLTLPYLTCLPLRPFCPSAMATSLCLAAFTASLDGQLELHFFIWFFAHRAVNFLVVSTTPCQTLFPMCRASRSGDRSIDCLHNI